MANVAILGYGQIGRAVEHIITDMRSDRDEYHGISKVIIMDMGSEKSYYRYSVNFEHVSVEEIAKILEKEFIHYVINALPFHLNEKVAKAAHIAKCAYIDFTEDDEMADKVKQIYENSGLTCAVKCGLAPGFINYIGHDLANSVKTPETLMVSVGALPRSVSYSATHPENSYNLTWSVDGLVNEYIRPCRIRKNGAFREVPPLGELENVIIDGQLYEAAHTSGGIGSLVDELCNIPNIHYMTLRYPGHYKYVKDVIQSNNSDFDKIKKVFLDKFSFTNDDVIVVYANILGKDKNNNVRKSYFNKFYGVDGLTAIQSTTAGSGCAILELMINNRLKGIVTHSTINLADFTDTYSFKNYYKTN